MPAWALSILALRTTLHTLSWAILNSVSWIFRIGPARLVTTVDAVDRRPRDQTMKLTYTAIPLGLYRVALSMRPMPPFSVVLDSTP